MTTNTVDHYEVRMATGRHRGGWFTTLAAATAWLTKSGHWGYVYHVTGTTR